MMVGATFSTADFISSFSAKAFVVLKTAFESSHHR
jgi:hypothetical protein